ncbi:hypothetical protein niasHT_004484 [Heterodera trifolii]|uniref:Uncharacterized protein n=1 Tax=Heterodera trifolii TaxID=157864 RepID=A0ABD2MDB5_9BILA
MMSCRACRLDKCLLEGMDPTMVEAEQSADLSQFIQTLYKRCEFLQQQLKENEEKICRMDTETVIENGTSDQRNEEDQILVRIERLEKLLEGSGNPTHIPMLERVEKLEKLVERLVEGENHQYGHRFGDAHQHTSITSALTANNGIQWGQPPPFAETDAVSQMITEAIINSKQHFFTSTGRIPMLEFCEWLIAQTMSCTTPIQLYVLCLSGRAIDAMSPTMADRPSPCCSKTFLAEREQRADREIRKTLMKSLLITGGRYDFSANLFTEEVPRRVIIGLVPNQNYIGHNQKNPFYFNHHNVRDIELTASGRTYPQFPYNLDYKNNRYARAYHDTQEHLGMACTTESNGISYSMFKTAYCLYVFQMTNAQEDAPGFEVALVVVLNNALQLRYSLVYVFVDGRGLLIIVEFRELFEQEVYDENYAVKTREEKEELIELVKGFRFYFTEQIGRFKLKVFNGKISHLTLTDQLAYVLGYEQEQEIRNEELAKYAVELGGGVSHLCIYLNSGVIESMIVGNTFANLLQVIAVEGKSGSVVEKDFQAPLFHKIIAREVDVLDVEIRTLTGREVPFEFGQVVLTLQFKKQIYQQNGGRGPISVFEGAPTFQRGYGYFLGVPRQKGASVGSVLRNLWRYLRPMVSAA